MAAITEQSGEYGYYIDYGEDAFLSLPDERKQYCYDTWVQKANDRKNKIVALRLIPDPLFPSGDNEKPYIFWQQKLEAAEVKQWSVEAKVQVFLTSTAEVTEHYLLMIIAELRTRYPVRTVYEITQPWGDINVMHSAGYNILKTGRL